MRRPREAYRRFRPAAAVMLATVWAAALAGAQAAVANGDDVPDFSEFKILSERNIFSPARRAPAAAREAERPAPPPEFRGQTLRLMGTVVREGRNVALFEGGDAAPSGGVAPGDTVAGYTVASIRTRGVTLNGPEGEVELAVGAGLKEEEGGRWVAVETAAVSRPAPTPPPSPGGSAPAASSASSGEEAPSSDDPVERMRERRRRELGQ